MSDCNPSSPDHLQTISFFAEPVFCNLYLGLCFYIWDFLSDCNPSSPDHLQSLFLVQSQGNVVKTEYSTFTYFITSLEDGQTVTSTDIVVSIDSIAVSVFVVILVV